MFEIKYYALNFVLAFFHMNIWKRNFVQLKEKFKWKFGRFSHFWVIFPSLCNLLFPALLWKLLQLEKPHIFPTFVLFRGQKLLLIFCVPLCDIWENNTSKSVSFWKLIYVVSPPISPFVFLKKENFKNQNNFGFFMCTTLQNTTSLWL